MSVACAWLVQNAQVRYSDPAAGAYEAGLLSQTGAAAKLHTLGALFVLEVKAKRLLLDQVRPMPHSHWQICVSCCRVCTGGW